MRRKSGSVGSALVLDIAGIEDHISCIFLKMCVFVCVKENVIPKGHFFCSIGLFKCLLW